MGDQSQGFGSLVSDDAVPYGDANPLDDIAIKTALANYNKALRIDPECLQAILGKARLMAAIDETDQALGGYQQALNIDKNCYDAHMGIAQVQLGLKHTPEAIKALKRAIKADKTRPEPHDRLADIYDRIGLDDLADEQREQAKSLRQPKKRRKTQK